LTFAELAKYFFLMSISWWCFIARAPSRGWRIWPRQSP